MSKMSTWAMEIRQQEALQQAIELAERESAFLLGVPAKKPSGSAGVPSPLTATASRPSDPSRDAAVLRGGICPYCGAVPKLVDSRVIYGRSYGLIYLCAPCDAYVGVHKGTTTALGRLANKELRELKKAVHAVFDPVWKQGHLSRNEAYAWLAKRMDLTADTCHVGMFDVKQCRLAIGLLEEWEGVTTEL